MRARDGGGVGGGEDGGVEAGVAVEVRDGALRVRWREWRMPYIGGRARGELGGGRGKVR